MFRTAWTLVLLCLGGCTVERIHHDARAGMDYLRITNGTQVVAPSRWQLPTTTRIAVSEIVPAARGDWLASAREGVGSVFGLSPGSREGNENTADLDLLIAWPGDRLEGAQNAGYIKYLRIDA